MAYTFQEILESFCLLCPLSSSSRMCAPLELGRREEGGKTQPGAGAPRECAAAHWSGAAAHLVRAGAPIWVCPVRTILPPPSARTYEGLFLGVFTDLLLVYILISTYFLKGSFRLNLIVSFWENFRERNSRTRERNS